MAVSPRGETSDIRHVGTFVSVFARPDRARDEPGTDSRAVAVTAMRARPSAPSALPTAVLLVVGVGVGGGARGGLGSLREAA